MASAPDRLNLTPEAGTGAGDAVDRGVKWWQVGSKFSDLFLQSLDGLTVFDQPFHWSGLNSESERRNAGKALLARLREVEAAGVTYHLVGHSHGGSVIWHALVGSAAENRPLSGLRSWATVGTPFLKFVAVRPDPWRWIAAIVLLGLAAWLFTLAPRSDWLPAIQTLWNDAAYRSLAFVGLFFGATAALCLWAVFRIGFLAVLHLFDRREHAAEMRAASWYSERWLALWHPLDEPTNSLAGTLGAAPLITPRVARDGIFGVIPFAGAVINGILARAADQFTWRLVTDRAQGADRRGYELLSVGRAPAVLFPGFEPLPQALASQMAASSDARSVDSVRRLRELLQNAYDTESSQVVLDRVSSVISFQEIIHTSYFDYPAIAQLLAAHVQTAGSTPVGARAAGTAAGAELQAPRRIVNPLIRPRTSLTTRGSLEFISACTLFIAPAIVFSIGARGAYEGVIAPLTTSYQIDTIAAALTKPNLLSAGNSGVIGELLLRLDALGRVSDPIAAVDQIPQGEPRMRTAARLAWTLWRQRGNFGDRATSATVRILRRLSALLRCDQGFWFHRLR